MASALDPADTVRGGLPETWAECAFPIRSHHRKDRRVSGFTMHRQLEPLSQNVRTISSPSDTVNAGVSLSDA